MILWWVYLRISPACVRKRLFHGEELSRCVRSFKCFCGREEIPYAYINRDTLLRYQSWLLAKGCARNTVSTYMRRIVTSII